MSEQQTRLCPSAAMDLQRQKFYHPYSPYEIQLQFMRALYECIEGGKIGIFESPTGTVYDASGDDEPDWMLEYSRKEKTRVLTEKWKDLEGRLARVRAEEERRRKASGNQERPKKKMKLDSEATKSELVDESQFELEEYESDTDAGKKSTGPGFSDVDGLSASTIALLERFRGHFSAPRNSKEDDDNDEIKIFYCSRTHSQLTQFAHELRRVNLPPSLPTPQQRSEEPSDTAETTELEEGLKHLSLGSRKQLCINPHVSSLGNATAINERCMELQKPGVAAERRCPYLPSKENEAALIDFRDRTLATVQDIEDIGQVGKQLGVCPYYAARSVVKHSEIITLPYPLLLQRSAREALNLSVKNHVVIIDEAHNLMDAISNIHSVVVTLDQLRTALSQLTIYARKYRTRLKGKNRVYVTQIIRLVSSIADNLQSIAESQKSMEGVVQYSDLVAGKGVDQINPHKLSRYLQESNLARKVDGYVDYSQQKDGGQPREKTTVPVLFQVQSFILSLMNPSAEGRLFFIKGDGSVQLKYMLLDPTNHFREIVEDARAVILAGGTMSPMSDYADHLFSYVPTDRLQTFSFGHVIPLENLTAQTLARGILGTEFNFTYDSRHSEQMITDLGQTIAKLCEVIPDGVVAFFPSYEYLSHVLNKWRKTLVGGRGPSILGLIEKHKTVFHEVQDKAANADDILQEYSNTIESGSGALLLSVVGGRLSEGINFSDRLGRGVLIVGLPFPNIQSAVWQAKIQHVEQTAYAKSSAGSEETRKAAAKAAARDFYENACMRAVNQCIGRAIRHRNDYAAIIMIDRRYDDDRIRRKLPAWIRQSLVAPSGSLRPAGKIRDDLTTFFEKHSSHRSM
ncbi:hypothetical protein VTN77DRAFT_9156 [Rasamsonia byssochlamydoides]|uniref:uncharacterized protein n=1 Tax=Rasamsonia byssochlamydoides TaxID=89139 RepID=UPI00374300FD